jgi:hypothetical protein
MATEQDYTAANIFLTLAKRREFLEDTKIELYMSVSHPFLLGYENNSKYEGFVRAAVVGGMVGRRSARRQMRQRRLRLHLYYQQPLHYTYWYYISYH